MDGATVEQIPVAAIDGGDNDRRWFGESSLRELADSIRANGLAQPITVRPRGERYEIVAGERRWRAHQMLGRELIPAIVRDMSDEDAATVMLIENVNRVDINPIEEAVAYQSRLDRFGWTVERLAEQTGRSVSTIKSRLGLLALAAGVQDAIRAGALWATAGQDIAHLDHPRQVLAVNCFIRDQTMTGPQWRALVARLTRDQQSDEGFSLFASGDEAVEAALTAARAEERPGTAALLQTLKAAWLQLPDGPTRDIVQDACRRHGVVVDDGRPPVFPKAGRPIRHSMKGT